MLVFVIGNRGSSINILNLNLEIPNILSTTFLKEPCLGLINSFSFSYSLSWYVKSCRWYSTPRYRAKN